MAKGGKGAKRKGSAGEREVVKELKMKDIKAKKVPLSGAVSEFEDDVLVGEEEKRAEVKRRRDGWKEIYSWLDGPDLLFMRADRKRWLVVMDLETFSKIWKGEI